MSEPRPADRRTRRRIALSVTAATIAAIAVATLIVLTPPDVPPAYTEERPEPEQDGYVTVSHSTHIDAPPEHVAAWANDPDLSLEEMVQFDGGFPAVVDTVALRGEWVPGTRVGDRRRVEFADGHFLAEEVLVDEPLQFRYLIWGFTSPQRFVVRQGVAEFLYEDHAGGTRVTWTYSLLPTIGVLEPAVHGFLDDTMGPMMTATLDAMREGAEAAWERVAD